MSIFQQQKIPGVACENGKKCTKMDINFFLFSRDEVQKYFKMHQNGCKCQKKIPGLTSEKIPQNAPQWISVCQKFPGSYLSKYLKVHQNGCQF